MSLPPEERLRPRAARGAEEEAAADRGHSAAAPRQLSESPDMFFVDPGGTAAEGGQAEGIGFCLAIQILECLFLVVSKSIFAIQGSNCSYV